MLLLWTRSLRRLGEIFRQLNYWIFETENHFACIEPWLPIRGGNVDLLVETLVTDLLNASQRECTSVYRINTKTNGIRQRFGVVFLALLAHRGFF